jgi:hypothetical protein
MENENEYSDKLLYHLYQTIKDVKENKLSRDEKIKLGEFFIKKSFSSEKIIKNQVENITQNFTEKDIQKFLYMGYYVYQNISR